MSITLYAYKNDTLSFVNEPLVPIKPQFVTQNTHIYTFEMKNGITVVFKVHFCDFSNHVFKLPSLLRRNRMK